MIRIAVCDDFRDTVTQVNEFLSEYQQLRERKLYIKATPHNGDEIRCHK